MKALAAWVASLTSAISLLGSLLAKTSVRLAAFAVLALVATWPMLSDAASLNTYRDSHPLVQYEESARNTVLTFGQVPLWDPYYCGGMDGLGTPQSRWASPTFLLTLVFGTLRAEPIVCFLFLLLGLEGTFRYARSRGATHLGAALAAPLFGLSGFFAVAPALGWVHFMGFALVPWIVWGLRIAMRGDALGVAVSAGMLAAMVGFGGTYPAPMTALFCAFEVGEALWAKKHDRARLNTAASMATLVALFALGLAALRLWPVIQTLTMAPRIIGGAPTLTPQKIALGLLGRIKPDEAGDFPLSGNYLVGMFGGLAFVVGLLRRRTMAITTAAFLSLWLASGYGAKISLFAALKGLPVYSTLRYPERFLVLFALAASAVAALGVTRLQAMTRARGQGARRDQLRLLGGATLTVAVTLLLANLGPLVSNMQTALKGRPMDTPPERAVGEFHQARGTRWALAYYGPMSRGVLSCYDAYPVPQSPLLRGDLANEEYLAEPDAGTVTRTYWSPNKIELDVDLARGARLLVNQNWHPGWRASVGDVVSSTGLLGVDLPAGKHHVVLRFLPRAAVGGALISFASLGLLLLFLRKARRLSGAARSKLAWRMAAATTAAVLLAGGAAFALVREPALVKPPAATPEGTPLVLEKLPDGVAPLAVKFADGMTLEGARLRRTTVLPEETLTLDLYWRVAENVDRRLGVFVHFVASEGEDIRADHVMLSDAIEPERAPKGVLLHDVVTVVIPHDTSGKTFKAFTGVWRVRGDTKRVNVIDEGKGVVEKHRVELGTVTVR
ncbi:MAG: hypothetical protein IPG50_34205 [Myxococcales bacterium]|nr:hypothetical protein [Myxococcales bacterium]